MTIRKALPLLVLMTALYIFAGPKPAHGQICSTMTISVSTAPGGATVTGSGGAFSVSFGNVNGLGIFTPAPGVSVSKSSSGATYTTPVRVTVSYVGCVGGTRSTHIYQDSTTSSASQSAAREGAAAASVISVPTTQVSATQINTSPPSDTTITRFVGVFVSNANGASRVTGTLAPGFIYRLVSQ
jgi:hypothetical protein